jgi:hypothetical protein
MNDWRDRAVDAALQELHGSKPPDLSARVVLALQPGASGPLPRLAPRAPRPPLWLLVASLALAAGLGAGGAIAAHHWLAPAAREVAAVLVEVAVDTGRIECVEGAVVNTLAADASPRGTFAAEPGNRLRASAPASFRLAAFGRLAVAPNTELEVRSMEFKKEHGAVAAASLTLGVIVGAVTWHSFTRTETAAAGEVLRLQAPAVGETEVAADDLGRLRQRVAELEQQNRNLLALSLTREPVEPPPPPPPVAEAPAEPAPAAAGPAFVDPRFAAALAKIDWATMGAVTHEMGPLLAELVATMEEKGEVSTEIAVKLQSLNPKLVEQLPAMLDAKVPGFGANGTYTHPVVTSNVLASTLAAAGQPLNETQRASISGLVHTFGVENQAIVDGVREFELEHLASEMEMKDRFYKEVSSLLTPEQYGAMYPEGSLTHERVGLFSSSLLTTGVSEGVPAANPGEFARRAANKLGDELDLDDATAAQVRGIVERMSGAATDLWRDKASRAELRLQMLRAGRTPAALRHQLEVMREIQRTVPLTPEQRTKLRKLRGVLVPLPR